jgi:leucyl/phenylalanyl-tRNA---protein transferase
LKGSEITTGILRRAYLAGAFPMCDDLATDEVSFYVPTHRCLFPLSGIRMTKSLAKTMRRLDYEVRFDTDFKHVMQSCIRTGLENPNDNWINESLIRLYCEAHNEGWAHTCEVWLDGEMIGGVYGLQFGSTFCAESMFHRKTDASKIALHHTIQHCRELGYQVFDAQIINDHTESLGAFEVPEAEFNRLFEQGLQNEPKSWT